MKSIQEKYCCIIFSALIVVVCIIVNGCVQTDPISPLSTPVPPIATTPMPENDRQYHEIPPELPGFYPNKNISYEDMKRFEENFTQPSPIPESEMARIIFSKTWFMQNDEDTRTSHVRLTFPVTWLDKPSVNDNEPVILLRVPKSALELNDVNSDPDLVTVSYTAERFKEFPNMTTVILT